MNVYPVSLSSFYGKTTKPLTVDNGRLEPRGIHWCYDSGLRVPLIVRWPKKFRSPTGYQVGGKSDDLISLIDVTAERRQNGICFTARNADG